MGLFKHKKLFIAICIGTFPAYTLAAPCAKSVSNGGLAKATVQVSLSFDTQTNDRKIAQALQANYGGKLAYDYADGYIDVTVIGTKFGVTSSVSFPITYDGSTSIEKAYLSAKNIDVNKADPNSCTPPAPPPTTSGGGSNNSGYYGGTTPDYGANPGYYTSVCYTCRTGSVTIEEG